MSGNHYLALGHLRDVAGFAQHLLKLQLSIPFETELLAGPDSPLAQPIRLKRFSIGNRFAIHPMEGWDATSDGKPSESTFRRWQMFGRSGAKLIWGGEAVAVRHDGRANPNQLLSSGRNGDELARLREALVGEHRLATGSTDGLVVGLQLTHSGRYSRPNCSSKPEPRILYHHPLLDPRLDLPADYPILSDGEIREIIEDYIVAAKAAREAGYDFVDIKHCHGYLGHEFLSARSREGDYGGSFENRTRFLREIVEGIRSATSDLEIGVRLSAYDSVPYRPDTELSNGAKRGPGVPEISGDQVPYDWGFGVDRHDPTQADFSETLRFLDLLRKLDISLVNISAGSPYYNPHIQRPALYPPSDGYLPPTDPLVEVARQMNAVRTLKREFPDLVMVGSAYTYLQDFLPHVAQAAIRDGWADIVGLGRMVLAYPELPADMLGGKPLQNKRFCRTFSDCTTAPRNGLPSGCYPLDAYYKESEAGDKLKQIKKALSVEEPLAPAATL